MNYDRYFSDKYFKNVKGNAHISKGKIMRELARISEMTSTEGVKKYFGIPTADEVSEVYLDDDEVIAEALFGEQDQINDGVVRDNLVGKIISSIKQANRARGHSVGRNNYPYNKDKPRDKTRQNLREFRGVSSDQILRESYLPFKIGQNPLVEVYFSFPFQEIKTNQRK